MKTPAGLDERCRQNQQSQAIQIENKGVQRRTHQHKNLSFVSGMFAPVGMCWTVKESKSDHRVEQEPGMWSVYRKSRDDRDI